MGTTDMCSACEQVLAGLGRFPSLSSPETPMFPTAADVHCGTAERDRGPAELPPRGKEGWSTAKVSLSPAQAY